MDLACLGLADLFRPDWVAGFLTWRIETSRTGRPNQTHIGIVTFFTGIVRNYLRVPYEEYQWLRDLRRQIGRQVHIGAPKDLPTYEDLERVADGLKEARLGALRKYRRVTFSRQRWQARMVRNELVVRLLLSRPLRSANLRALRWGQHVVEREGAWWIEIPPEEVKNGQPLHFEFPPDLVPLLNEYRAQHWPVLAGDSRSDVVFPVQGGAPMGGKDLLQMIRDACRRYAGRHMTVHRFRDVVATTILKEEPGAYPLVSALLGHTGIKTALVHYGHLDAAQAAERVDRWRTSRTKAHAAESPLTSDRALIGSAA